MEEKKLDILVAIPSMGEVSMVFTAALVGMILKTKEKYPNCTIKLATSIRRLIHRSRAELAEAFLETDCNYLMWIDDDNPPKPDDLNKLIELDLPIVSGLYFRRNPPYEPIIMVERENGIGTERRPDLYRNGAKTPFKVHSTGMGFMLMKREVVENVKALGVSLFEIRGHIGEDIWFCLQARQAGYDVMVAPEVEIAHLGDRLVITGETYNDYYKKHIEDLVSEAEKYDDKISSEELRYLAEQAANSNFTIKTGVINESIAKVLSNSKKLVCVSDNQENNFVDESADMIFLDGHKEVEKYLPKMKRHGKIIIQNYDGIEEFMEKNKYLVAGQQIQNTGFYEIINL